MDLHPKRIKVVARQFFLYLTLKTRVDSGASLSFVMVCLYNFFFKLWHCSYIFIVEWLSPSSFLWSSMQFSDFGDLEASSPGKMAIYNYTSAGTYTFQSLS